MIRKFWVATGVLAAVVSLTGCDQKAEAKVLKAVPVRADGKLELQLATFNIRYENNEDLNERSWHQRVDRAVRMIRRLKPDVVGMQELVHGQAADLRASLPDYEFFGQGRDDGNKLGEYAGIFFRGDRFERDVNDGGTFWLSATPEEAGSKTFGNTLPRIVTWTRLVDRESGRGFYIFNTHFDHRHQGSREQAALLLASRIDARRHPDEPVVVTGDFNAQDTNPALAYLAGKPAIIAGTPRNWPNSLIETFQAAHPNERASQSLNFFGSKAGWKIDYILVSKTAHITAAAIEADVQPFASDHFPVSAHVVFP